MAGTGPTAGFAARRSAGFIAVVALANAGGVVAFMPLLTLLLPIKLEVMAGDARLSLLSATAIVGAVAASIGNIVFGWLSDRSAARGRGRRGWVAFGLVAVALSYAGVAVADGAAQVIGAIVAFQLAVNALLAPLHAIMAEDIPDAQKGLAGGLLALGQPLGAAVSTLILALALTSLAASLALVFATVAACAVPLLARPTRIADQPDAVGAGAVAPRALLPRRDLAVAWLVRLVMQVAGIVPMIYLYYYFASVAPELPRAALAVWTGTLMTVAAAAGLPVAALAGRWSDASARRKPFLLALGAMTAAGLGAMALAETRAAAAAAFVTYMVGWTAFQALHSGFAMQLLPDPRRRGRDLGVLNLTNTLPSLLGPALTWWLATPRDFDALLLTLAALAAAGSLLVLAIRGQR